MGSRMARFLVGMICLQVGFLNGVLCWAQGFWQGCWVHRVGFLCSPRVPIQPRRHHPKAIPDRTARERTSPIRAQRSPGFTPRGPGLASRQYSPLKTRAMRVQKSGTHTLSQNGRFKVFTLSPTPTTLLMSKQLLHKQVNMYLPTIPVALIRQESITCTTYISQESSTCTASYTIGSLRSLRTHHTLLLLGIMASTTATKISSS